MRIRTDRLTWRDVDGDIVALDLETSTYFSANGTASVLLRALTDGATKEDLVGLIVKDFRVDDATAAADVDAFIQSLQELDLLDVD